MLRDLATSSTGDMVTARYVHVVSTLTAYERVIARTERIQFHREWNLAYYHRIKAARWGAPSAAAAGQIGRPLSTPTRP